MIYCKTANINQTSQRSKSVSRTSRFNCNIKAALHTYWIPIQRVFAIKIFFSIKTMLRFCFYPITEMDEAGNCLLLINRMMDHDDIPTGRLGDSGNSSKRRDNWFQDVRNTHQHQAEYLLKLARLRDELITQEHSNLLNAMERVYTEAYSRSSTHAAMPIRPKRRPNTQSTGPQNFPIRHKKMQQEKAERLERFRRGRSPPQLEPIEGKQMADPSKVIAPISVRDSASVSNEPKGVKYSEERINEKELMKLISSGKNGTINLQQFIKPTSSIPHVGYKALKPEKSVLGAGSKTTNKSKQKSKTTHLFNPKTPGLYTTITKQANGHTYHDKELSLSPCALGIESQIEKRERMMEEDACAAPRASPEMWERYLTTDIDTSHLPRGFKQRLTKATTPRDQQDHLFHKEKNGIVGYNDYMLRRNTTILQENGPGSSRAHSFKSNETPDVLKLPGFRRQETNEWIDQVALENKPNETSYVEPNKTTDEIALPDINQSQSFPHSTKDSLSLVSVETDRETSPSCRKLVVEMPDITCQPPTPLPSPSDDKGDEQQPTTNKSLQKTFKQNALRQKEIHNLLEDVKEFNQIAENLQEKVSVKEHVQKNKK